jgi:pimeloyl-ACP methyl ester carboxylesterase
MQASTSSTSLERMDGACGKDCAGAAGIFFKTWTQAVFLPFYNENYTPDQDGMTELTVTQLVFHQHARKDMNVKKLAVLFAAIPAAIAAQSANAASPLDPQRPFSKPHQLIDIGGRKLNLHCSGSGPLTVVFDAPSTDAGWSWVGVQPEIAKRTRACVYDRAGLGFSDPSPRTGISGHAVEDLHALLGKAGIAPPYVMVGTSYGGANVQLYAYRYPAEVKGLVLVEPQHEDETERLDKVVQGKLKQFYAQQNEMEKACAAQAEKGFQPEHLKQCIGEVPSQFGPELAKAYLAVMSSAKQWRAATSEDFNFDQGGDQLRAARRSFGDMPVVVLTRGVSPFAVPGKPQSAMNKAFENENRKMHKEVAALSTRGSERVVPGTGHIIQADKPQAVVKAINEVLDQLK